MKMWQTTMPFHTCVMQIGNVHIQVDMQIMLVAILLIVSLQVGTDYM